MMQAELRTLKAALTTEQQTYANHIQAAAKARKRIRGLKVAVEKAERKVWCPEPSAHLAALDKAQAIAMRGGTDG